MRSACDSSPDVKRPRQPEEAVDGASTPLQGRHRDFIIPHPKPLAGAAGGLRCHRRVGGRRQAVDRLGVVTGREQVQAAREALTRARDADEQLRSALAEATVWLTLAVDNDEGDDKPID
jgi:hypothetical protein